MRHAGFLTTVSALACLALAAGWASVPGARVARAQADPARGLPAYTGYVNDFARILSPGTRQRLEQTLTALERETTAEVAVVTVATTAPETPKMYAVRLLEKWGVGKKGKDNGALLLVAVEERSVELEVGYGLEPVITDGVAGALLDEHVVPHFRRGDFDRGVAEGAAALADRIRAGVGADAGADAGAGAGKGATPTPARGPSGGVPWRLLLLVPLLGLAGAFFLSGRQRCPRCGRFALVAESKVVQEATPSLQGMGLRVSRCVRCGYHREVPFEIPWVDPDLWRGGGGYSGGGRGGGGRGGFGGFGGGRSGGGGAGRKW